MIYLASDKVTSNKVYCISSLSTVGVTRKQPIFLIKKKKNGSKSWFRGKQAIKTSTEVYLVKF